MSVSSAPASGSPRPVAAARPVVGRPGARLRTRRLTALAVLAVVVGVACLLSVAIGARSLSLGQIWLGLTAGSDAGLTGADQEAYLIIRSLRLPRTVVGLVVGAALGVSGALMQGHTRNPLADPGILGVSAGAAFAVVLAIRLLGVTSSAGYVWFAFAGAAAAAVVVYVLGSAGRAGATPVTLALAGTAMSFLLASLTSAVQILDIDTLDAFRFWAVGSVAGRGLDVLVPLLPFLAVGFVLAAVNAPSLNVLSLGEDVARGLGQHIGRTRVVGVLAVTLLVGAAVAACGPIGFVGLVVPHVARSFSGPDHRWLLPMSALAGAALLLLADVLGRVVVRPGELQVGIVLALAGAPVFIALVRRRRLVQL